MSNGLPPSYRHRNRWRSVVESPADRLPALIPPVEVEGVEPIVGPIPSAGQDTNDILSEIGLMRRHHRMATEKGTVVIEFKRIIMVYKRGAVPSPARNNPPEPT